MKRRQDINAGVWRDRRLRFGLVAVFLLCVLLPGWAAVHAEEPLSPEALEIANQLNCPVCQGQSVRDSNSELARQMRQLIQEKLDQGQTREEILAYFVERYGVSVLREPPRQGFLWLLWWGPAIGLVIGILVVALYLRQRRPATEEPASEMPPAALERVERLLGPEGDFLR